MSWRLHTLQKAALCSVLPFNLFLVVIFLYLHLFFQLQDHVLQELPALLIRLGDLSRAAGGTGYFLWLMAGTGAGQKFLIRAAAWRAGAGAAAFPTFCLGGRNIIIGWSPVKVEQLKKIMRQCSLMSIGDHGAHAAPRGAFPKVTGKYVIFVIAAFLPRRSSCQERFPVR